MKTVFIPIVAYYWTAEDVNPIGCGFLPFFNSEQDIIDNYGEGTECIEVLLNESQLPDRPSSRPFDDRGLGLN